MTRMEEQDAKRPGKKEVQERFDCDFEIEDLNLQFMHSIRDLSSLHEYGSRSLNIELYCRVLTTNKKGFTKAAFSLFHNKEITKMSDRIGLHENHPAISVGYYQNIVEDRIFGFLEIPKHNIDHLLSCLLAHKIKRLFEK